MGFGVLTYYLGLSCTAALAFLFEGGGLAKTLSDIPHVGDILAHPWVRYTIPAVLLGLMVTWFVLLATLKRTIRIRKHDFRLPKPIIGLLQVIVSCADLCIVASVLWVLLPSHDGMDWLSFVGSSPSSSSSHFSPRYRVESACLKASCSSFSLRSPPSNPKSSRCF